MANSKPDNQITAERRKNMPSRGKSKRSLILDALRENALLELDTDASREDAEKAVFAFIANAAFNPTKDTAVVANTCLNHIMSKGWANLKPVMPSVEFTLNETDPSKQAAEILKAVASGEISPDVAHMLITSISSILKIKEVTELEDRIKALEDDQES